MTKRIDYHEGYKFPNTRLSFIKRTSCDTRHRWKALFQCDCGKVTETKIDKVKGCRTTSCGCYKKEIDKQRRWPRRVGPFKRDPSKIYGKHFMSKSPEYKSWDKMIGRTCNLNSDSYNYYGGRGITVCDRWRHSFENFYRDMGPKPSPEYSIERIDVNGNYEPGNCRWVTSKEQARNKRSTIIVTYKGITKPLIDWSEDLKLDYKVLYNRLRSNWVIEDIFEKPIENSNLYTLNIDNYKNESKTVKEWSRILGISFYTVQARLDRGWSIDDALLTSVQKSLLKPTSNKPPWVKVWGIK